MKRFRKWILTVGIALALLMPLASAASADPNDAGYRLGTRAPASTTTTNVSDGGW